MCEGRKDEDICCSSVNTGVFQAFLDVGDVAATFAGHDHGECKLAFSQLLSTHLTV